MAQRNQSRAAQMRKRVAHEAARLIVESGIRDYAVAKRKAAGQLRLEGFAALPKNEEIEAAVGDFQRLFRAESRRGHLDTLMRAALDALRFLERFHPCVVGALVRGTADEHSPLTLHLFAEPPEEVGLFLLQEGIPYQLAEKRFRYAADDWREYPFYSFFAEDVLIELVVFPLNGRRQAPLSPLDGRPMQRLDAKAFEMWCQDGAGTSPGSATDYD